MSVRVLFDNGFKSLEEWLFICLKPKSGEIDLEDIRELVRRGVNVDARDKSGATPLMHAVKSSLAAAEILLQAGADLNAQNKAGYTALGWALNNWNISGVAFLLEKGIDVNLAEDDGRTALMAAAYKVSCVGGEGVLDKVIAAGAHLEETDAKGRTAWDYANGDVRALVRLDAALATCRREKEEAVVLSRRTAAAQTQRILRGKAVKFRLEKGPAS